MSQQQTATTAVNSVHESDRPAPATLQANGSPDDGLLQVPPAAEDRSNDGPEGLNLDSNARWQDAALHARGKIGQNAALQGHNDVRSRWKRAVFLANRLANGRGIVTSGPKYDVNDPAAQTAKILETQHWLEMIDPKHRYGHNMKNYFRVWSAEDTKQNFFQWLDHGGGKDLDLPECPRETLERERIVYLSAEQRLNYLTVIDEQGRLRWARNGEFVDTTPGRWKDAGQGQGIIPTDGTEDDRQDLSLLRRSSFDSLPSDDDDSLPNSPGATTRTSKENECPVKHTTSDVIKKTLNKPKWLYVANMDYNIFVGIKQTGTFQHSSFFAGSVSSAGLLTVDNGLVTSLRPHSGHYRTTIPFFEVFVKQITDRGLDLHKVHITKEEAVLWGTAHWGKFNRSKGEFVRTGKDQMRSALESVKNIVTGDKHRYEKEVRQKADVENEP